MGWFQSWSGQLNALAKARLDRNAITSQWVDTEPGGSAVWSGRQLRKKLSVLTIQSFNFPAFFTRLGRGRFALPKASPSERQMLAGLGRSNENTRIPAARSAVVLNGCIQFWWRPQLLVFHVRPRGRRKLPRARHSIPSLSGC